MDNIYKFVKSDLVHIKSFLNDYKSNLNINDCELPKTEKDIAELMGFSDDDDEEFKKLVDSVSLDKHLTDDKHKEIHGCQTVHKKSLGCFKKAEDLKKETSLKSIKQIISYKKKYYGSPFGTSELSNKQIKYTRPPENECNLKPYEDVVISIRFYKPFRFATEGASQTGPKFLEEFLVLGSEYLTELRDKIFCKCNNQRFLDISNNPDSKNKSYPTNPGFFFITNVFYNDTRNPNNYDYSKVIREWAKSRPEFKNNPIDNVAKMENTRFIDLSVHLGFPQVYQHHGNCEHVFVFSSIRLLHPSDILKKESYPLLNTCSQIYSRLCNICGNKQFIYLVTNSEKQLHDPCYLCITCFKSFFYVNGKKIEDNFQAYRLDPSDEITNEKGEKCNLSQFLEDSTDEDTESESSSD